MELGWHTLRNRSFETRNDSSEERDAREAHYFSETGLWATANPEFVGITKLKPRLSKELLEKIKNELPKIADELAGKFAQFKVEKDLLGDSRETEAEQLRYLNRASVAFESIAKAAVDGTYHGDFFEDDSSVIGKQKRLRAVIKQANQEFANSMREKGRRLIITDTGFDLINLATAHPRDDRHIPRSEYLGIITRKLERSRGTELPGLFNSNVCLLPDYLNPLI